MNVPFRSLCLTGLLLLSATAAFAQKPGGEHHKPKTWYLDKKQKEFYTPAEAKKGKYHNEVGEKLTRADRIPQGYKTTDDFKKAAVKSNASTRTTPSASKHGA